MHRYHGTIYFLSLVGILFATVGFPNGPLDWWKSKTAPTGFSSELMFTANASHHDRWTVVKTPCSQFSDVGNVKRLCDTSRVLVPVLQVGAALVLFLYVWDPLTSTKRRVTIVRLVAVGLLMAVSIALMLAHGNTAITGFKRRAGPYALLSSVIVIQAFSITLALSNESSFLRRKLAYSDDLKEVEMALL